MQRIFGTDGIRGVPGEPPLDRRTIRRLGMLLAARTGAGRFLLGRDTRESGVWITEALAEGIAAGGGTAVLGGVLPTPAVSRLVPEGRFAGGAVISASHNPYHDNGIKLLSGEGAKLPDSEEAALEKSLLAGERTPVPGGEVLAEEGLWHDRYIEDLVSGGHHLGGLRVVLDCAHGATTHLAEEVFARLGAEVLEVLGDAPDGRNINEGCGSLHPEALAGRVSDLGAGLGVAFDGDGDRAILVDGGGAVRDGDDVLWACATDRLGRDDLPGPGIVGTLMTNVGLETGLRDRRIDLVRAAVGDRYVREAMREKGYVLGGEPSGHVIFMDRAATGDGILTGVETAGVMARAGRSLAEVCDGWTRCPQVLINVPVRFRTPVEEVPTLDAARLRAEEEMEGTGRVLLRYSGTENLLRVMVEGPDEKQVASLAAGIAGVAEQALGPDPE
jgi:phosphoglucosamine mutase